MWLWKLLCALFELLSVEMGDSLLDEGGFAGFGCKGGCAGARAQGKGSTLEEKQASPPGDTAPRALLAQSEAVNPRGVNSDPSQPCSIQVPLQVALRRGAPCPLLGAMSPFCPCSGKATGSDPSQLLPAKVSKALS